MNTLEGGDEEWTEELNYGEESKDIFETGTLCKKKKSKNEQSN